MIFLLTVLITCAVLFLFCAFLGFRNNQVCQFRMKLIDQIYDAALTDLDAWSISEGSPPDSHWRYDALKSVSYNRMWLMFWKPLKLETFYDDLSFIYPKVSA